MEYDTFQVAVDTSIKFLLAVLVISVIYFVAWVLIDDYKYRKECRQKNIDYKSKAGDKK